MDFTDSFPSALGSPIPDDPHAVSVSLPRWADVDGYEQGDPAVIAAMQCGYPRFFLHKSYRALCESFADAATPQEEVFVLPSKTVAEKCIRFIGTGRVQETNSRIALAIFPKESFKAAQQFWQHTGLIISSRQAEKLLNGETEADSQVDANGIKTILASLMNVSKRDIYLSPTGMSAIFEAYEAVTSQRGSKTIQLGFPYVDTWKIQQKFGKGAVYLPYNSPDDLDAVLNVVKEGGVSAVFCEIPGNPLLRTVDLPRLKEILGPHSIPLIIDDTLGPPVNINVMPYADMIVTSLTKFFSGVGNVMGGSLILNAGSPHYGSLKEYIDNHHEDLLHPSDAKVLRRNAHDFPSRMQTINANAVKLVDFLRTDPAVKQVYFTEGDPAFEAIRVDGGGHGGLVTIALKNSEKAPAVYDNFDNRIVRKGPSLGTDFTLVSAYTMMAHYYELQWANDNGVETNLLRISVGTEDIKELIPCFYTALRFADDVPVLKRKPTSAPAAKPA